MKKSEISTSFVFSLFLAIVLYKLNASSLWFDEAIEYWISKIMFGALPLTLLDGTENMYQRIVITFQPPLYNLIMWLWLQIHDGALWFRLASALFGFVGIIGLYKAIKLNTNALFANIGVLISAFTYKLIYYFQECAEYSLMLCFLCWALYYYSKAIRTFCRKDIIIFTLFSIASIYSQYGAAFAILPLLVSVLWKAISQKNKKVTQTIIVTYSISAIFAAIPLVVYFLIPQIIRQQNINGKVLIVLNEPIFLDWFKDIYKVVIANFFNFPGFSSIAIAILISVIVVASVFVVIFGKNRIAKHYIICLFITYTLYYSAVKLGLYAITEGHSAGHFFRYSIFFVPFLLLSFFLIIYETYQNLKIYYVVKVICPYIAGILLFLLFAFCGLNWKFKLSDGMKKEPDHDLRGAINEWYNQGGNCEYTIVEDWLLCGFLYYERHHDNYTNVIDSKIIIDHNEPNKNQLFKQMSKKNPSVLYAIYYTYDDQLDSLISASAEYGYHCKEVFFNGNVKVICFEKKQSNQLSFN